MKLEMRPRQGVCTGCCCSSALGAEELPSSGWADGRALQLPLPKATTKRLSVNPLRGQCFRFLLAEFNVSASYRIRLGHSSVLKLMSSGIHFPSQTSGVLGLSCRLPQATFINRGTVCAPVFFWCSHPHCVCCGRGVHSGHIDRPPVSAAWRRLQRGGRDGSGRSSISAISE